MRGSIWEIVAIGICLALLPAIVTYDGSDALGNDLGSLISSLSPVIGSLFFVTIMAVVVLFVFDFGGLR